MSFHCFYLVAARGRISDMDEQHRPAARGRYFFESRSFVLP